MRGCKRLAVAWVALVAHGAWADKTTDELQAQYDNESTACQVVAGGVAKVSDGAAALQDAATGAERDELTPVIAKLAAGRAVVDSYCSELAGVLALLHDHPTAHYKELERELDERDNKIRKLRADEKRTVAELDPIIRTLVPRINARVTAGANGNERKQAPTKFPSGRSVVLPVLPGQWQLSGSPASDNADYSDASGKVAVRASVWTRRFDGATCDQQRKSNAAAADDALPAPAHELGVAWWARQPARPDAQRELAVACLPATDGKSGWMAYATIEPVATTAPAALRDALDGLMVRMLDAQLHSPPVAAAQGPAPAQP